jgi:hypothetical protein
MSQMTLATALRIADKAQKAKIALRCKLDKLNGLPTHEGEFAVAFSSLDEVVVYMRNTFSVMKAMQEELDEYEKTDAVSREILDIAALMKLDIPKSGETVNE